jgi:hypothetical protein
MKKQKDQSVQFGFLMTAMAGAILTLVWLVYSLIFWDFSVSSLALRALLVLSVLAGVVSYIAYIFMT